MSGRHRFLIVVVLAACQHDAPPPSSPVSAASPCVGIADHFVQLIAREASHADPTVIDQFRTAIRTRCEQDRWSSTAQQCLASLADIDAIRTCRSLTQEQVDALDRSLGGGSSRAAEP